MDASSAAALHRSLARLRESHRDGYEIVQLLATLPMQLARYFSTGAQDRDTWGHYALAAPRYTHFTSPIRRYPDVLVHRQVAAALDAGFTPSGFRGAYSASGAPRRPRARGGRAAAAAAADAFGLPDSETLKASPRTASASSPRRLCRTARRTPTCARTCAHRPRWRVGSCARLGASTCGCSSPPSGARRACPAEGLRHVTATSAGPGAGAGAVALAFEPTATPEDLRMASDPDAARDARKRAMKASRGARGPYLNVSEAEHAALRDAEASASASPRGERSDDEDVFACGAPPRRLPATIRPVERVCLLLGATLPARAKPEMTAALLLRNPLAEA